MRGWQQGQRLRGAGLLACVLLSPPLALPALHSLTACVASTHCLCCIHSPPDLTRTSPLPRPFTPGPYLALAMRRLAPGVESQDLGDALVRMCMHVCGLTGLIL